MSKRRNFTSKIDNIIPLLKYLLGIFEIIYYIYVYI